MHFTSFVQAIFNVALRQTFPQIGLISAIRPSWLQTNKANSGSLDGVQAVGTTLPILGDPESATFWVNASRVLPLLTIGNVKNPSIFVVFFSKKREKEKEKEEKKKQIKTTKKRRNKKKLKK